MRYDQFMKLGWKVLIPASLIWIIGVSVVRLARSEDGIDNRTLLILAAVAAVLILLTAFIPERQEPEPDPISGEFDAFAGGYPVPPMPGQRLPEAVVTVPADEPDQLPQTPEDPRG
jgi:NADH-quinone oxidoreductase subunit H